MFLIRRYFRRHDLPPTMVYLRFWLVRWKHGPGLLWGELPYVARAFGPWLRSVRGRPDPLQMAEPWLAMTARMFLARHLTRRSVVFEFGSGASTLFYARRVASVMAVEHDPVWAGRVREALRRHRMRNAACVCVQPESGLGGADPVAAEAFGSFSDIHYRADTFRAYVSTIDRFPDEHFDLVSVDGRSRPSCIEHAWRKVKRGGHLLLDDADRPHYRPAQEMLASWPMEEFSGPFPFSVKLNEVTRVWRRPLEDTATHPRTIGPRARGKA